MKKKLTTIPDRTSSYFFEMNNGQVALKPITESLHRRNITVMKVTVRLRINTTMKVLEEVGAVGIIKIKHGEVTRTLDEKFEGDSLQEVLSKAAQWASSYLYGLKAQG